jgi:hypothetical protein
VPADGSGGRRLDFGPCAIASDSGGTMSAMLDGICLTKDNMHVVVERKMCATDDSWDKDGYR